MNLISDGEYSDTVAEEGKIYVKILFPLLLTLRLGIIPVKKPIIQLWILYCL